MSKILISTNPAKNYEEIDSINTSTDEEVAQAVKIAKEAFPAWKQTSFEEKVPFFQKFLELMKSEADTIAELQTKEMGKPIQRSKGEVNGAIGWLEWHLANAGKFLEVKVLDKEDGYQTELHLEPFGVCAAIAPWNFPTYQFFLAVMQQLLAGNVVVLKHSEECPLTSQKLAELMQQAGFPEGVFACLYGDGSVGKKLLEQDIDLIHFTGSSRVGEEIYKIAAEKFIPVVLEMGGSSPGIVFDDTDLTKVCNSVYTERFDNCGQVCCALKRLLVHEDVYDEVVKQLKETIENQVVGDPLDEKTTIGPLVAERQVSVIEEQVEDAKQKGATILTGGKRPEKLQGAFYEPTLIIDTTPDMKVVAEETFGPVLPVIKFSTEEEAIKIANDTEYGLSAFVYSQDQERALRVAQSLEAGQVSINGCLYFSSHAPFGGYKKSGIGRGDGEYGYYNVAQMKVISRLLE